MEKYIFTFPSIHPLKNHYQPVFANDYSTARERMFERYGEDWAFQYTKEEWDEWQQEAKRLGMKPEKELSPIYTKEVSDMKCFADTNKGCSALTKKKCDDCNFYKTQEQVEQEERLTQERLKSIKDKSINIFS